MRRTFRDVIFVLEEDEDNNMGRKKKKEKKSYNHFVRNSLIGTSEWWWVSSIGDILLSCNIVKRIQRGKPGGKEKEREKRCVPWGMASFTVHVG